MQEAGVVIGLLAFFPMFLSIGCGRWIDRAGSRRPVLAGGALVAADMAVPFAFPAAQFGLVTLAIGCSLVGIGVMVVMVLVQRLIGFASTNSNRLANFAWQSTAMAASGFISPVLSGIIIDHAGYRFAFGFGAVVSVAGLLITIASLRRLPASWEGRAAAQSKGGSLALLGVPRLRNVLLVSALVFMAWDLQTFMFPVYGRAVGFSATEIGWLVGAFFSASFIVRFLTPFLARRFREWQFLTGVLVLGSTSYFGFPFFTAFPPPFACAFVLGLGLGASQPNVMSLLQTESPAGRADEAIGIRTMLTSLCHAVLPAGFGALAGLFGPFWIFMAMASLMGGAAIAIRFRNRSGDGGGAA
ncbi:MFS transporter [Mesosutterella porci]|nr:MFS transporter [Mesosutterella sp. oilRF-744-WT-GAM-9]